MSELVWCPACGGPGKVEADALGREAVVCDAYDPCSAAEQAAAAKVLGAGFADWMARRAAEEVRARRRALRVVGPAPLFDGAPDGWAS